MALLDRVKERVETDLGDAEIQSMIDAVVADIEGRFGPNAEITVEHDFGPEPVTGRRLLSFQRPIDTGETVAVVEVEGVAETTLAADDYRITHGGRTMRRLTTGTNGRAYWPPEVRVTYTPVSDAERREEVVIQVVQLEIEARGLTGERAGDWQASYPDLAATRERLIQQLAPRPGLAMA